MTDNDFETGGIEGVTELSEIGRGGFGVVYGGVEESFRREVAVKVLPATSDQKGRDRFERERMAMGALTGHPNIVTVYRGGFTAQEQPYLVMEYLPGGSLDDELANSGPLGWQQVADVGVKMAGAVETAHRSGVLHRDIKPGNIFRSSLGEPKLGDFGISRLKGGTETRSAAVTASVAHAPPEVIAGQRPDESSDVYSLGSTLYELLAGSPAYFVKDETSIAPMLGRIATAELPPIDVPSAAVPLVQAHGQAMHRERAMRPSAAQLGELIRSSQGAAGLAATTLQVIGDAPLTRNDAELTSQLTPVAVSAPLAATPSQPNSNRLAVSLAAAVAVLVLFVGGILLLNRGDSEPEVATGDTTAPPTTLAQETTEPVEGTTSLPATTLPLPSESTVVPSKGSEITDVVVEPGAIQFVTGRDKTGGIELDVPESWTAITIDITEDPLLAGILGLLDNPAGVTFGGTTAQLAGDGPDAREWNISGAYVSKLNSGKSPDERIDSGISTDGDGMSGWSECTIGERGDVQSPIGPGRYQQFVNCGGTSTTTYDMFFLHRSDPDIMVELVVQLSEDLEKDPDVLQRIVGSLQVDLSKIDTEFGAADADDNKRHIDHSGAITAEIPRAWADALSLDYRDDLGLSGAEVIGVSGVSFGLTATELAHGDEGLRSFERSGVSFKASRTEPTLDPQGYESCDVGATTNVNVDAGTGTMQEFTDCGGQDARAYFMVLQSSRDSGVYITMWLQIVDRAEFDLDLENGIPEWLRIDTSKVAE